MLYTLDILKFLLACSWVNFKWSFFSGEFDLLSVDWFWIGLDSEMSEELRNQKLIDTDLCSQTLDLLYLHMLRNTLFGCLSILLLETVLSFSHWYRFQWSKDPACYSGLPTYYSSYIHVASNYRVLKSGLCYSEITSYIWTLESPMETYPAVTLGPHKTISLSFSV